MKLVAPEAIKPFVKKGKKNDAADAAAICQAACRPDIRFVPVKSLEQQGILAVHSARSLLVKQKTMLANAMRGLATEFGVTVPRGIGRLEELVVLADVGNTLPGRARQVIKELHEHCRILAASIEVLEAEIVAHARQDEAARRLATIPGVGPITASLMAATVADIGLFKSARQFAAWLGLVPRQYSTGGKTRLGRITKSGNRELRKSLVLGATSMVYRAAACRRGLDQGDLGAPPRQAGHGGAGEQDGAHRLGVDDAQGDLPSQRACHGRGASRGLTVPREMVESGRKPG